MSTPQYNIAWLPGDGIGPEVTREALRVLEAVASTHGFSITAEEHLAGGAAIDATGSPLPDETRTARPSPTRPARPARTATLCCSAPSAGRSGTT